MFAKLGLNLSSAVNIFFRQAVREQAIPFQIKADMDNYFNKYNMKRILESIEQAKNGDVIVNTMVELDEIENNLKSKFYSK